MKTILLVDADFNVLVTLNEVLSRAGHHIILKSDADSAFCELREGTKVDLVITDYQMTGTNGLSFMSMLRQLIPSVPVIVLTSQGSVDIYLKAMSLGAFECMFKPVNACELNRIVRAALEWPQSDDHMPIYARQ